MTAKLYLSYLCNNALRAAVLIKEKNLDVQFVPVNLATGEHKTEDFLRLNPRGQVPCYIDGETRVLESAAICQFLEAKHPTPSLSGDNDVDMATCFTLIHQFQQKLDPKDVLVSILFKGQGVPELGERFDALMTEMQIWEDQLQDRVYFANTFTIADIMVLGFVAPFYEICKLPPAKFPLMHAWYERVKARPSFQELGGKWLTSWEEFTESKGGNLDVFKDVQ